VDPALRMPAAAHVILSILSGPSKGASHTLTKPRVIVGREGADIVLDDPEISRHHCLLEVRETYLNLKDMDSTNGTFLDEERARAAMLRDGTEFRIGGSVIRVNFQRK
jgi:pSer/pThr/pTyr-binding forkhead associated (FHA) protein